MKEPSEVKLTPEIELLVQKAVESRLEKLPATTYTLIEKMVEDRVAKTEKFYHKIVAVVVVALGVVSWAFFNATAHNASEKASEAIVKSALGQKLKDVEQAHSQILNIKNQVAAVSPEALESANKITAKLRELESQDNIVRLSYNGNLVLNLQDGELRLRRKNPDKEIIMNLDKDGHFHISNGNTYLDVLEGTFMRTGQ